MKRFCNFIWSLFGRNRLGAAELAEHNLLRSVIDHCVEGIAVANQDGRFLIFNKAMEDILGRPAISGGVMEWAKGYDIYDSPGKPSKSEELPLARALVNRERVQNKELLVRRPDGSEIWISVNAGPLPDGNAIATASDITAHKKAQAEVEDSLHRLQDILDLAYNGFVLMDTNGAVLLWNVAAERDTGWRKEEAIGRQVADLIIPPEYRQSHLEGVRRFLETGQSTLFGTVIELTLLTRDQALVPIELSLTAIQNKGHYEFAGFFRNISERKEAEQFLRDQSKALQKANQELEQFAYVASHDLKAPLRAISNLAYWIEEGIGDKFTDETKEHMTKLQGRVRRMNNLIEGILQYSRVGRLYTETEEVDMDEALADILGSLDKKRFTITSQKLPVVRANPVTILQLFTNLIQNAVKHHTREDGRVDITVEEGDSEYVFSVQDDGPGIDQLYHERLFGLFQTLGKKQDDSTGIGLALCKQIVEAAGGKIWLDPDYKNGCRFRFSWPKL